MNEPDGLASQFQLLRPYLISVGYSMLGSVSEAEDAVQESWLRLRRTDPGAIEDLRAWLTTVVGRICLDMLKARQARREDKAGTWLPEPLVAEPATDGPESQAIIADSNYDGVVRVNLLTGDRGLASASESWAAESPRARRPATRTAARRRRGRGGRP